MPAWPDTEEALLSQFVKHLKLRSEAPVRSVLRGFQRFVSRRATKPPLGATTISAWLRHRSKESPLQTVRQYGHLVNAFLDWLVEQRALAWNPIAEARREYCARSTAAVLRAIVQPRPKEALEALRPLPRYGSHLGVAIHQHVERMRTLGFRYDEKRFLRFDRFLQQRTGAADEPLSGLVREYAEMAESAASKLDRIKVGRVLANSLNRSGVPTAAPSRDRMLMREVIRKRCKPYIYSAEEVRLLLETARRYPSPKAPLRPLTLYTMIVLAYCAGLRVGEIAGLEMKDVDLKAGTIEVRDTKFFKSRRLPLSSDALEALQHYVNAREKAGASSNPEAALFWHEKGGYRYYAVEGLLRRVIQRAGLRKRPSRGGPRIHDLRHAFVVHRMTEWYRQGINPQGHLPHLAAYLGHRDIHSTLVYLTITQELLQHANERFRTAEADVVKRIRGKQ
jgi:integrase/recombinase XerD